MLIDSHCHLHDREFFTKEEAEQAIKKAAAADVTKIICIGTDPDDSEAARIFAEKHDNVFYTYGIHPSECQKFAVKKPISSNKLVAIGEIGLDYHYAPETREDQIKLFEELLQLATDKNLPVSFHIREAFDDFFGIIQNFPKIRGVVHSFSDSKKTLKRILNETDFYVGLNGLATYSTLPTPPLEKILLETDAPFLAPTPYRGTKNEPAYIKEIAGWLAEKTATTLDEVAKITSENVQNLFGI
ncbi:MAG: TatD family hydrolase [Candidatus Saccharibacteria bacterium]|nr:TatD family hydrolase [Candidatus Saccharibacteria bacterium]